MPKVVLDNITSGYASTTQINGNNDTIETAFDNTISRDGSSPNAMNANLDLNGNNVLNVENIQATSLTLNGTGVTPAEVAATPAASAITVADSGGYFAGANVEAVLQDVGAAYTKNAASETITADWTFQGDNTFQGDDTVEGSLGFNDNVKAQFGTGNDIDIYHNGTKGIIDAISSGTLDIQTTGSSRMDITDSGVRLGGGNARVTTVIDDDTMATASATTLATSESIKAYVDLVEHSSSPQATTSGTSIDYTSIPSGVTEIVIGFDDFGIASGTVDIDITIGDSGGLETTGYNSCSFGDTANNPSTASFQIDIAGGSELHSGAVTLKLVEASSNTWMCHGGWGSANRAKSVSGHKSLSGTLDRLQVAAASSSFDSGQIFLTYRY